MHHAYVNTRPCRYSRSDAGQMPAEKILSILCLVGLHAPMPDRCRQRIFMSELCLVCLLAPMLDRCRQRIILSILCLVGLLAPHIEGAEGFLAQENL